MVKEKRIKILIIALLLFLVGFTKVNATSYTGFDYTAKLYDNVNGTITSVKTNGPYNEGLYEGYIPYTANSSGGAWLISSPLTLVANHTYTLTASIPNECGPLTLSSVNRIGVGTILNNAKASYQNNTDVNEVYSRVIGGNYFLIQFAFTPTINGSYIVFPFATSVTCDSSRTILANIIIDDLGINSATEEQINTSLNNQTNTINNSIQNSTDTIINNQNQNNEELKDTINDNFNSCRPSKNLFPLPESQTLNGITYIKNNDGTFNLNGIATANAEFSVWKNYNEVNIDLLNKNYYFISDNIETNNNIIFQISTWNGSIGNTTWVNTPYQAKGDGLLNTGYSNVGNLIRFTILIENGKSVDLKNVKLMLAESSSAVEWEPYGEEICSNKIDETNDKLDNLNSSLNNSNSSGATNDASNFFSNFTTDTFGLTSIITSPLNLINSITSTSCSSLKLPLPYLKNEYLELPCMSTVYNKYFGSFFNMYQIITFGIVSYWVIVRIFNQVKDFKNPDHDEIEVLDL